MKLLPPLLQRLLPLLVVAALALALRTWDLAGRPMHADEANQGVKAGELLGGGGYAFDPSDHHGPTLYYAVLPLAGLRGEADLAALSETTLRLVPARAGTAAVLLLGGLVRLATGQASDSRSKTGPSASDGPTADGSILGQRTWPAVTAAAFLALSPPAVYYSRYFIQETLLAALALAAFAAALRWWQTGRTGWAAAAGLAAGLMQATKGSAPIFLAAAAIAALALRPRAPAPRAWRRAGLAAAGAAVLAVVLFHTSFGTNPGGLRDFAASFGHAADRLGGASGHEKPWWYYLSLFGWQRQGGVLWQQLPLALLAAGGVGIAVVTRRPLLRWAAVYTVIVAAVLSATPYKTPWHAIHLVPGLAILATGTLEALARRPAGRILALAAGLLGLASLAQQTRLAAFQRPADERNPYAYVHSSPDVRKFRDLVTTTLAAHPGGPIRIVSEEYWPLPWYLRGLPGVGYWSTPPADCDAPLLIVSATQAEAVRAHLHGSYRTALLGLRPGFICVVYTPEP